MQRIHLRSISWLALALFGFAAIYFLTSTGVINPFYRITLMTIMLNVIYAAGLNLILGVAGQFSLGHAGFIAIGAYSAAIFTKEMDNSTLGLFVGIAVGMVIAMIVALLVGVPTLRLKGDYLAIATLGVSEIIRVLINNLRDITNGPAGISGIPLVTTWELVYIFLIVIVTIIVCYTYSSSGRATLAINQNEIAAEAMGVSGSVSYLFDNTAVFVIANQDTEEVMMALLEADVDVRDVQQEDEQVVVYGEPTDFSHIKDALEAFGIEKFEVAELEMLPKSEVTLGKEDLAQFEKLIDALEDDEDVQKVYHNVDL